MIVCLKWKIRANEEGDFKDYINPDSLQIVTNAVYAEPALAKCKAWMRVISLSAKDILRWIKIQRKIKLYLTGQLH